MSIAKIVLKQTFQDVPSRSERAEVTITEFDCDEGFLYVLEYAHHEGTDVHMGDKATILAAQQLTEPSDIINYPGYNTYLRHIEAVMKTI